jgi:hypothetical protein
LTHLSQDQLPALSFMHAGELAHVQKMGQYRFAHIASQIVIAAQYMHVFD